MANIPPSEIAHGIIGIIDDALRACGLPHSEALEEVLYAIIVVGIACGIGWMVRRVAVFITNRMRWFRRLSKTSAKQTEAMLVSVSHVIPPLVFLSLIPFAFTSESKILSGIIKLAEIYFIVAFALALNAFLGFAWHRYNEVGNVRNHPLKGLPQIAKGFVWLIAVILIIATIVNRSPLALFTGLGAFAAVVLLVFKDSILGLVAGVQLSQNDMLRVGDWIVVPGTPANGIVTDVSLTVVKVRNWDNTLAMLPPYTLVSTSFRNWRNMFDSGRRQISITFNISSTSVREPSLSELDKLEHTIPILSDFISLKRKQREKGVTENTRNSEGAVNGSIDTNLGLFRAYLTLYLRNHPFVAQDVFMMVSELDPTTQGIPLRVYCYTSITDWVSHESIQSELIEHIALMAPLFNLSVYQPLTDLTPTKY